MSNMKPLVLQSADSSGGAQCISGCMYRIVQTTSLDGKNLLKLIPLPNIPGHYIPAVPLPVSTGSAPSKVNVSTVIRVATQPKTTTCSTPTAYLPVLQQTNTGSFLITSLEGSASHSGMSPVNPSCENIFAVPAVASLQCPSLTPVTLPGLPMQKTQESPILATDQKGYNLRRVTVPGVPVQSNQTPPALATDQMAYNLTTVTLPGPAVQKTQASPTLATDQMSYNLATVTLPSLPVQKTQESPILATDQKVYNLRRVTVPGVPVQSNQTPPALATDQMAYNLTTVTLPGPAVQKTQASPTLPMDQKAYNLTTVTLPGLPVQSTQAPPTLATNQKTFMLVKSPVLPSGHHLQIPANAEVKSVPASSLPLAIQQKILATAASNLANSAESTKPSPTVIYVCPVNTVKTTPKRLPNIRPKNIVQLPTALAVGDSPVQGAAAPAAVVSSAAVSNAEQSQSQDSVMKWVVQKNPQSLAHCLIPVKSSNNLASKILKSLADQQHAESGTTNLIPLASTAPSEKGANVFSAFKENALVMYNGKVYLVVQKNSGLPSPCPESVPASGSLTEKENALSAVLSRTDLITKIKEEPEDPDSEPFEQKENQFLSRPADTCRMAFGVQNPYDQHRAQDVPGTVREHTETICGTAREETDEQLLKKAGIHTDLRICLTRISAKQLEQWEKSNSTASSESLETPTYLTEKTDNLQTDAINKETQVNLILPVVKKEEPIETEYYAYHTKEIEIKLEPKSAVKRKPESNKCSVTVKKQRIKRFISNWESEHAYSCHPEYNMEAPSHGTEAASLVDSHCGQETFTSSTEPSSVPQESMIMESSPTMTVSTGTVSAHSPSAVSTVPVPSTSSPSMGHSPTAEISETCSYSPLPPSSVDETTRDEKIRRLKEILKEKEAALEAIRRKMIKSKSAVKKKTESNKCPLIIKKQRFKRWILNRESEHAYSCLPGHNADGTAQVSLPCELETFTSSLSTSSVSGDRRIMESSHMMTRSTVTESVPSTSAVSGTHFPTVEILPPLSVDKGMREEKIRRLKEILKEKEAALETIRRRKISTPS
ncbi:ligand-dependent nuclear receptor-interacting factor 1-like isoform X2 [Heptranchias perlo]|uniref:ligand-dependent nuclear receptor-interacting factor 1-like isoform X2 n=1 Tax=Heptranchias perlo TaxID=212740 RepID=UPI00355A0103